VIDYAPYAGLKIKPPGEPPEPAHGAPHVLVCAPTRTGKTRVILAPAAVLHPGPVVACSSKEDLAKLILTRRGLGPTGVIDLRPDKTLEWPAEVRQLVTDPTSSITTAHEALTVAETMLATSGVGFGGVSAGSSVGAGGLWELNAAPMLAALLYAAGPEGDGGGMPWVLAAVQNFGDGMGLDEEADQAAAMIVTNVPSWRRAYVLCPHPLLAEPLLAVLQMEGRLRDSLKLTVTKAVAPWVRLGLSAAAAEAPDALEEMRVESFDLDMLDDPNATLFVLAPNTGTAAGAAVALIDSIIRRFRQKTANDNLEYRLLLELDEVCNSCPLPNLLTYVGESAGLGVNILATVQASSHFDVIYGPAYATALRDIFPGTLIMYGAKEKYLLEQAAHWAGLTNRRTDSTDSTTGARTRASAYGQMLEWQELLPRNRKTAQLLRIDPSGEQEGSANEPVYLPSWDEFLNLHQQAIRQVAGLR